MQLGVSERTVLRWLEELVDSELVLKENKGYRLKGIRKLEKDYVKARRQSLAYSRTLCVVKELKSWQEVRDLLYLKLVERHARRTYFQARHDGDLRDVIKKLDQRTKRNDGSSNRGIKHGESLAILLSMSSIMNVLEVSKNTAHAWRERMKTKGYIKTYTTCQVVTEVIGLKGPVPIGKMNTRQFHAFIEENPKLLKGHSFLGRNGQVMNKAPLAYQFVDFPLYHTAPKGKNRVKSLVRTGTPDGFQR